MRVLIADTDVSFQDTVGEELFASGHEVHCASNGVDSLRIWNKTPLELVILDRELLWGGADGVLAVVEEAPISLAQTSVILLANDFRDAWGCQSPNVVAWLKKPVPVRDLVSRVNSQSRHTQMWSPSNEISANHLLHFSREKQHEIASRGMELNDWNYNNSKGSKHVE